MIKGKWKQICQQMCQQIFHQTYQLSISENEMSKELNIQKMALDLLSV